jgi:hypothetical protein
MIYILFVVQIVFRFIAPFVVPFALIFAKKTDERNKVWAPFRDDKFPKQMRRLPSWLKWIETPDDQLIPSGLYEDTVLKTYEKYGWFISQWVWWGFRNVGHGFHYKYIIPITEEEGDKLKKSKALGPFEIRYGYKVLSDWYKVTNSDHYAIPRFTVRIKK